jgi:hypothetical protein
MERLADGDRAAFHPVFAVLWPLLRRFATRHLRPEEAEEAAQEALVKILFRRSAGCWWASHSRLAPFVRFARMIREHVEPTASARSIPTSPRSGTAVETFPSDDYTFWRRATRRMSRRKS